MKRIVREVTAYNKSAALQTGGGTAAKHRYCHYLEEAEMLELAELISLSVEGNIVLEYLYIVAYINSKYILFWYV